MRKSTIGLCILAICVSLFCIGCRKTVPIQNPTGSVPGYETVSESQVRDAILLGGTRANWQMAEERPGLIKGTYFIRAHSVVVNITYDQKSYQIIYVSSTNLDADGANIHPNYNKWVQRLNNNISSELLMIRKN